MEEPASFRVLVIQTLFSTFQLLAQGNLHSENTTVPKDIYHNRTKKCN